MSGDMPPTSNAVDTRGRHHWCMTSSSGPSRPRPPRRPSRPAAKVTRTGDGGKPEGVDGAPKPRPLPIPRGAASPTRERSSTLKDRRTRRSVTGATLPQTLAVGGVEISIRLLGALIVTGLLLFMLVPSLFQWWGQEQELRRITAQVEEAKKRNAHLEEQLELWRNPDYISARARERLGYVKPGETQYTVMDPGEKYLDQAQVAAAANEGPPRPWIQVVALSLEAADNPEQAVELMSEGQSQGQQTPQSAGQ